MANRTKRKKIIPSYHDIKYIKLMIAVLVPPAVIMLLLLNVSPVLSWACGMVVTVGVVVLATSLFCEVYCEVKHPQEMEVRREDISSKR